MIRIWFEPSQRRQRHLYHLAGEQAVSVDRRLPALEPFLVAQGLPPELPPTASPSDLFAAGRQSHTTYDGQAWLGGAQRRVEAKSGNGGSLLHIEGGDEYELFKSGEIVRRGASDRPDGDEAAVTLAAEVLFGPALLLQLAWRSRFALHASAIDRGGRTVAFIGDSAAGKSTVAAACHQPSSRRQGGWQRVADDILPVVWAAGPLAAPHFPQFKLPAEHQYPRSEPPLRALAAVYLLAPPPQGSSITHPVAEPLGRKESLLTLVRHTVASRLFDARLQTLLFDTLAQATADLPVYRLLYPHTAASLAEVPDRVEEGLRSDRYRES